MKLHILGMSTDRRRIQYDLFTSSKQVVRHIMKLIQFPKAQAKEHWARGIHAFLSDVPRLKGSNKFPSTKFIYDEISAHNDTLPGIISYVRDTEPDEEFANISEKDCLIILEDYEYWLAHRLSNYGSVTLKDVISELKGLGLLD